MSPHGDFWRRLTAAEHRGGGAGDVPTQAAMLAARARILEQARGEVRAALARARAETPIGGRETAGEPSPADGALVARYDAAYGVVSDPDASRAAIARRLDRLAQTARCRGVVAPPDGAANA